MKKFNSKPLFSLVQVVQTRLVMVCLMFCLAIGQASGQQPLQKYYQINGTANSYFQRGLYSQAVTEYSKMIALIPTRVDGYQLRARAYYCLGEYDKAIADFTRGMRYEPVRYASGELYFSRASCYVEKGNHARAILDYSEALKRYGPNPEAYEHRAYSYAKLGKYALAIQDFTTTLKVGRKAVHTYVARCESYLKLKDYKNALADCQLATQINPKSSLAWGELGKTRYTMGNLAEAINAISKARSISPDDYWLSAKLGLFRAVQNDWNASKSAYEVNFIYADKSEIKEAISEVQNASRQHPNVKALVRAKRLLAEQLNLKP